MLLVIGGLIGMNLAVRIILSEARELRLQGRAGLRGRTRMRWGDIARIVWRGALFLAIPTVIGAGLDQWLGTSIGVFVE